LVNKDVELEGMEHIVISLFGNNLIIVSEAEKVIAICFDSQDEFKFYLNRSKENSQSVYLRSVRKEFEAYSTGNKKFRTGVLLNGTPFQKLVWEEVSKIPYGKTLSYQQIAKNIRKPSASRAVANAIGKNPIVILIPCHRVIRSNGKIGGYSAGIKTKEALLSHESVQADLYSKTTDSDN
jgi:methylated-DNA-[protein]-cysteine S-methyltransferase